MHPPLCVEPLGPGNRDAWLRFFDHERGAAFADNPQWAKCYCHYYHVPKRMDWEAFDARANRTAMTARIDVGEMEGFLASAEDEVVGWLNAQPLHKLPHCWGRLGVAPPPSSLPAAETAAIVCFVIAPSWRRRGVARSLLQGALASLGGRGVRRVFAFPFTAAGDAAPTAHYHGPGTLFEEAGFRAIGTGPGLTIVAKELAPTGPAQAA